MTKEEMKQAVCRAIDEEAEKIRELALRIEAESELGFKEVKTAAKVEAYMKELGLAPKTGLALIGVKARVDGVKEGPAVAVLAELDAIGTPDSPKLEQKITKQIGKKHIDWSLSGMAYIYIMTNVSKTVLYIGVTNNLHRRYKEHFSGINEGFTKRYRLHSLVYYEQYDDIKEAILREKQLKKWSREKKEHLVRTLNPDWQNLFSQWE
jgi:predicted GIY-YIG superfamily endonuclease